MKYKALKSKLQKNSRSQSRKGVTRNSNKSEAGVYPPLDGQGLVLNDGPNGNATPRHPFDLEERTAVFGEAIIRFTHKIPRSPGNDRLIGQLVGCGTSVGANYCEANGRVSRKDFALSISRCAKEAHETKFFLRMVAAAEPGLAVEARAHYREANELHRIFAKIFHRSRGGPK